MKVSQQASELFKSAARFVWHARSRVPGLRSAIHCRLPDGSMFLAHGDTMGWSVFSRTVLRNMPVYEEGEQRFVRRLLREGMVVIDVGANQGLYTLAAARIVGNRGRVFALEPAQTEYEKLCRNIAVNRLTNVTAEPFAVGAQEGVTEFHLCLDGRGNFSSRRPLASDLEQLHRVRVEVPLVTLDKFCEDRQINRCDLVKIDVEGGERDVLLGARRILSSCQPVVMCELADVRTAPWNYPALEIYRILQDMGYDWFRPSNSGLLSPAPSKERYDPEWEDLIAIPRSRRTMFSMQLPELA